MSNLRNSSGDTHLILCPPPHWVYTLTSVELQGMSNVAQLSFSWGQSREFWTEIKRYCNILFYILYRGLSCLHLVSSFALELCKLREGLELEGAARMHHHLLLGEAVLALDICACDT